MLELLRNLKKERADVLLMFNAMIAEFANLSDAERFMVIINGKSYDWWREHLITALEFFDQMRDRIISSHPSISHFHTGTTGIPCSVPSSS